MTEQEAIKSALKKLRDQRENFGNLERPTVDENFVMIKALEKMLDSDTKSHDEEHILKYCIALMHELVSDFQEWYEWVHGENAISNLDDEEVFRIDKSYFHIVKNLFLYHTNHSGGTSTIKKCNELGVDDWGEDIEFGFDRRDEE